MKIPSPQPLHLFAVAQQDVFFERIAEQLSVHGPHRYGAVTGSGVLWSLYAGMLS